MIKKETHGKAKDIIKILKNRFEKNMARHKELVWEGVQKKLELNPDKLKVLEGMEKTGGEPDVVGFDKNTKEFIFFDCASESPISRRSLCYDLSARKSRKANPPKSSAQELAQTIGVQLLTEEEYFTLQKLGEYDTKTSSWIQTPIDIRKQGGALFGDRRYNAVFIYHNGADSYYAARGCRFSLRV
jgi:hypothetical protein